MNDERKPLLTEEQIQEMLKHSEGHVVEANNWLNREDPFVWGIMNRANADPVIVGMDLFLAFLRGKTKRVLNLDRLRADVKAWVDDPNRKYPEWMAQLNPKIIIGFGKPYLKTDEMSEFMSINYHSFYPYSFASMVGINPDDYFEEVEEIC